MIDIFEGDNRAHLARLIEMGVRVHSVVTDPPYGLTSVTKRLGGENAKPIVQGTDGAFARTSKGFMGSKWDGTGIERDPDFWALIYDILLPGGYCLAFSGSRTGHWQACAMEMAGFVMHPMLGWVFGQGFPKAHDASKAIDRELGAVRRVVGHEKMRDIRNGNGRSQGEGIHAAAREGQDVAYIEHAITEAATPEAALWEGWAYGGQALKPALEPIYVGQKPFSEKNGALNLLKHGVGAINIDGCRVPAAGRPLIVSKSEKSVNTFGNGLNGSSAAGTTDLGRHPANLLHDGSDAVVALFPQTPGSGATRTLIRNAKTREDGWGMDANGDSTDLRDAGTGSAARFFNCFPLDVEPVFYQPKAAKADRAGSRHPTVKPAALMRWLCRLVTPPGGVVLDPFAGSGTTGEAARLEGFNSLLMEAEPDYAAFLKARFRRDDPPGLAGDIFG